MESINEKLAAQPGQEGEGRQGDIGPSAPPADRQGQNENLTAPAGAQEAVSAPPTVDDLRRKIEEAQRALETAKAELAKREEQEKRDQEIAALVEAYRAEYPALRQVEDAAENYLGAETRCLREILTPQIADQVPNVVTEEHKKVADLEESIKKRESDLSDKKAELGQAATHRDATRKWLEALRKPAASVKERWKIADGFKTEVKKAHDVGEYAAAYWILTDATKYEGAVHGEPKLITPDNLSAMLNDAADQLADAIANVASLEATIATRAKSIETDKTRLAELKKSSDARIRERLATLTRQQTRAA
jgi:hypothetical protein